MACATIILAAAATAVVTPASLPDIEISARVQAREVQIEQQGRASARVTGEASNGPRVAVERNLPKGRATYRNLDLKLSVEARLVDPPDASARTAEDSAATTNEDTGDE
jgi:hypothetical protein